MPAGQLWHAEPSGENDPAGHCTQALPLNCEPARQPEHAHAPAVDDRPNGQLWHVPPSIENWFGAHGVHELLPGVDELPHAQSTHCAAPGLLV